MNVMALVGSVIVVALAVAGLHDHRRRRRGRKQFRLVLPVAALDRGSSYAHSMASARV
jgi:hypothetical protein